MIRPLPGLPLTGRADDALFHEFISRVNVVTPIDPDRPDIKARQNILAKWEDELKQEAPYAYKQIDPVIDTQVDAGIVRKIAELEPILTVKG